MPNSDLPIHPSLKTRLRSWLREEFSPTALPRSLSAGITLFLLEVIFVVSFGALIFKGEIAQFLPRALTFILVGDALLVLVVALLSSYPGSIAVEQDTPAVIMALAVGSLVAALPSGLADESVLSTVLIFILSFTLILGLVFFFLGVFKLGGFVRFLPYPVMGGFLAGTGWLLALGGIGLMQPTASGMALFAPEMMPLWLPGLFGGALILLLRQKWPHPLTLIGTTFGILVLFYVVVLILQVPLDTLRTSGWLLGEFPKSAPWAFPLSAERLALVQWDAVLSAVPDAIPAIIIGVIALLLNASSLELVVKKDLDINRELMSVGAGNIAGALGGGLIGYHAISLSTLNHRMTQGKRLPGVLIAILFGLTVLFGLQMLAYVPRVVLGSLLVYLGLDLLYEWVIVVWKKFPRVDGLIVMGILATIIARDFLWGIGIGMLLTIVMFLVSYSRVNIIRYTVSAATYRSRYLRQNEDDRILQLHGDKILILKLDGFIFFGTANNLYEEVKRLFKGSQVQPLQFVILDFAMVNGLDTTGLLSFEKMLDYTRGRRATLVLSGLTGRAKDQFEKGGFVEAVDGLMLQPNLDRAIEFCETHVIVENSSTFRRERSLKKHLMKLIPSEAGVEALIGYMEKRTYIPGEYLMRTGDPPSEIIFIESGQVTVQLEPEGEAPVRLETTGGGRAVGELGFYLGRPRTADVVADTDTRAYVLSQEAFEKIKQENAEALHVLSQVIIHQSSERIVAMTRALDALRK